MAEEVVLTAADYLDFKAIDELKTGLAQMRESLVHLAAAGLWGGISFSLQDDQGVCGVQVTIFPYEVGDYQASDLSRLRLLANPEACGSIEVGCLDGTLAHQIVGDDWLPPSSATLEYTQVDLKVSGNESDRHQEDNDEHDDDY